MTNNLIINISKNVVYDLNWFFIRSLVNKYKQQFKEYYRQYEFWFNNKFNGG